MRVCPLTGSSAYLDFFVPTSKVAMTSDQRIVNCPLDKIIFQESGVVANRSPFAIADLYQLYGNDYQLNTSGADEHVFYSSMGPIARSTLYFDWIKDFIPSQAVALVEIGCGEGRVLKQISMNFPKIETTGFDGSFQAALLGAAKGLNISQKIITGQEILPEADVYMLLGVIEHIDNLESVFTCLKSALNPGGRLIFTLPIQSEHAYDFLFVDHVWHFTESQFTGVLLNNGLKVLHADCHHPINHGFGLFVCEVANTPVASCNDSLPLMVSNLQYWTEKFQAFGNWCDENTNNVLAVFGASEVFTLFMAYSKLAERAPFTLLDDSKPESFQKHGIQVYKSDWLEYNPVETVVLAMNKKYHELVMRKFAHLKLRFKSIY